MDVALLKDPTSVNYDSAYRKPEWGQGQPDLSHGFGQDKKGRPLRGWFTRLRTPGFPLAPSIISFTPKPSSPQSLQSFKDEHTCHRFDSKCEDSRFKVKRSSIVAVSHPRLMGSEFDIDVSDDREVVQLHFSSCVGSSINSRLTTTEFQFNYTFDSINKLSSWGCGPSEDWIHLFFLFAEIV